MPEPERILVAVATYDRQPAYVHGTLASLWAKSEAARRAPMLLHVASASGAFLAPTLERWRPDAFTKKLAFWRPPAVTPDGRYYIDGAGTVVADAPPKPIDVLDLGGEEGWKSYEESYAVRHRTAVNFGRILAYAARRDVDGAVVLQDDVIFAPRWLERLVAIVEHLEANHHKRVRAAPRGEPPRYVLTLYASYKFKLRDEGYNDDYKPTRFYGNQALYLPRSVFGPLLDFWAQELTAKARPDDIMLRDFLAYGGAKLYVANPNLVQHVGDKSAIDSVFHRSPTFKDR